jgi:hypothetical protein
METYQDHVNFRSSRGREYALPRRLCKPNSQGPVAVPSIERIEDRQVAEVPGF